jgi:hypothetical protein
MEAPKRLNFPYLITKDTSPSRENLEVFGFSSSDGCLETATCLASTQALRSRCVSSASKHLGTSDQGGQTGPPGRLDRPRESDRPRRSDHPYWAVEPAWVAAPCDAPGFQPDSLTLMNRLTELTLVKQWSTWAITSKTSPTTPKDTPWLTHGQGWVKTLVKPVEHPLTP